MPGGHLQPLASPDPLNPLRIHQPTCLSREGRDLAIAITAVLASKLDDVGRELLLIGTAPRDLALCRAMLSERPAGPTLGYIHRVQDVLDAGAPSRGA